MASLWSPRHLVGPRSKWMDWRYSAGKTIENKLKTKVIVFGKQIKFDLTLKGQIIKQVGHYNYLGNVVRTIQWPHGDIRRENYEYPCDKARKAIFGLLTRLRDIGQLPPLAMKNLFESFVQPILTYESDVWGVSKPGMDAVDKVLLWFLRLVLHVKPTTSNFPAVTLSIGIICD